MNTIKMRERLKDVVKVVPRSNEDMKALYAEKFPPPVPPKLVEVPRESFTYTYVGGGESPCPSVNFMGIQLFTRGIATQVSDPVILSKIDGNSSFVKGEADPEEMQRNVEEAKKRADAQRAKDAETQRWAERNRA